MKKVIIICGMVLLLTGCSKSSGGNTLNMQYRGSGTVDPEGDITSGTGANTPDTILPSETSDTVVSSESSDTFTADESSNAFAASDDTQTEMLEFSNPGDEIEAAKDSGDIIQIKEKMFVTQMNDIYINTEDYLGKSIEYEGMFKSVYYEAEDITYHMVIRYGPGCCGYDGESGLEVIWEDESKTYPNVDDWVRVQGVLEQYEENGYNYLRLRLNEIEVLDVRGAEYVNQ